MRDEEKRRGLVAHGRGGTGTNRLHLHTQGHGSRYFIRQHPILYYCYDFACGYEQRERRRRDSFYVVFAFEIGFVGGCSVRVFERSFEGGSATYGGSAHMSSADWRRFG